MGRETRSLPLPVLTSSRSRLDPLVVRTSHADADFSSGTTCLQIPDGVRDLAQRVRPVNDGRDLARLDEFLQDKDLPHPLPQVVLTKTAGPPC
jgi:hypothetical protein